MDPSANRQPSPPVNGEDWISQTVVFARGLAAVGLLAGGAVLAFADWSSAGLPSQFYMALVWSAPALVYFPLSFFVRRAHGQVCLVIFFFTAVHAIATFFSPLLIGTGMIAAAFPPYTILGFAEAMPWYFLLIFALIAGMANLMVAAFWARKWIREPHLRSRVRGFEVMVSQS
jgi:glucan phosphoethanolaminetransferase (alkaline phosphatase superfamily)